MNGIREDIKLQIKELLKQLKTCSEMDREWIQNEIDRLMSILEEN